MYWSVKFASSSMEKILEPKWCSTGSIANASRQIAWEIESSHHACLRESDTIKAFLKSKTPQEARRLASRISNVPLETVNAASAASKCIYCKSQPGLDFPKLRLFHFFWLRGWRKGPTITSDHIFGLSLKPRSEKLESQVLCSYCDTKCHKFSFRYQIIVISKALRKG